MDYKVSVVVPIFNIFPYLEDCINSILEQTYDNIEIVLVDDGSTDDVEDYVRNILRNMKT